MCARSLLGLTAACFSFAADGVPHAASEALCGSAEARDDLNCPSAPRAGAPSAALLAAGGKRVSSTARGGEKAAYIYETQPFDVQLKYLHIPKTGGTSIDYINLAQPPGHRIFESLMSRTTDRVFQDWHLNGSTTPGALFKRSHSTPIEYMTYLDAASAQYYNRAPPGSNDTCEDIHLPPDADERVRRYFGDNTSTVFCAVRDPLHRFFSAYSMNAIGGCTADEVEKTTQSLLESLRSRPFMHGCMFLPMVHMVYGASSKELSTVQYCDEILHLENLNSQFDALMQKYGRNVTLPDEHLMNWDNMCDVNLSSITNATRGMVYDFYVEDFRAFGYPSPL